MRFLHRQNKTNIFEPTAHHYGRSRSDDDTVNRAQTRRIQPLRVNLIAERVMSLAFEIAEA